MFAFEYEFLLFFFACFWQVFHVIITRGGVFNLHPHSSCICVENYLSKKKKKNETEKHKFAFVLKGICKEDAVDKDRMKICYIEWYLYISYLIDFQNKKN